jgi:hypothetical protein
MKLSDLHLTLDCATAKRASRIDQDSLGYAFLAEEMVAVGSDRMEVGLQAE